MQLDQCWGVCAETLLRKLVEVARKAGCDFALVVARGGVASGPGVQDVVAERAEMRGVEFFGGVIDADAEARTQEIGERAAEIAVYVRRGGSVEWARAWRRVGGGTWNR